MVPLHGKYIDPTVDCPYQFCLMEQRSDVVWLDDTVAAHTPNLKQDRVTHIFQTYDSY